MDKKDWQKPELVTHGLVSDITKGILDKRLGFTDDVWVIGNIAGEPTTGS